MGHKVESQHEENEVNELNPFGFDGEPNGSVDVGVDPGDGFGAVVLAFGLVNEFTITFKAKKSIGFGVEQPPNEQNYRESGGEPKKSSPALARFVGILEGSVES